MVGDLLKAIRPLNLVIVAIIQLLLYYKVLLPHIDNPRLTTITFGGFVISGIFLTASGYLINDYYDYYGDQINKQDWHRLTQSQLLITTGMTTLLGVFLSLWVAYSIDELSYALIYVLAAALLYSYSAWGKRKPLIGNLMVSAFCGLSITVLLLTEWPEVIKIAQAAPQVVELILGLSVFAFLITLVREIVKDVEDIKGDTAQGYNTLPIKIGIPRTKLMIMWYLGITLILAIWWAISQWNEQSVVANLYFTLGVIGSLSYLLYRATHLHGNASYAQLSKLCKYAMLVGIVYVVVV